MGLGEKNWGQLGDGSFIDRYSPVHIMDNVIAVSAGEGFSTAIKYDNSLWAWSIGSYGQSESDEWEHQNPIPVHIMDNVAAVSAGAGHTMTIRVDGSIWTWGGDVYSYLGLPR